ncbi:hypothetical protein C4J81_03205 [Deltaproteobacteria bacterium Smac51]|nr:hypothetical protein C4J81_03205 [Deltaproteobacteria bacterium Smac51]
MSGCDFGLYDKIKKKIGGYSGVYIDCTCVASKQLNKAIAHQFNLRMHFGPNEEIEVEFEKSFRDKISFPYTRFTSSHQSFTDMYIHASDDSFVIYDKKGGYAIYVWDLAKC